MQYKEVAPHADSAEFEKVARSRRSVRIFTAEKIPHDVVEKCLDLALLAPNSSNLQPWGFYWIQSESVKTKMVEACFSQSAAKTADTLIVAVARPWLWRANCARMRDALANTNPPKAVQMYYQKIAPFVYTQGLIGEIGFMKRILFFFVGLFKVVPRGPNSHGEMREWAVKTTALACENLMLAFRAYNFDTCPMEGFDESRVKKLLKLKRQDKVVMIVGAGRRAENGVFAPSLRFDRNLFIQKI